MSKVKEEGGGSITCLCLRVDLWWLQGGGAGGFT